MILLVCSLLLGGCKDVVTPIQDMLVCTEEMQKNYTCSPQGNPDAVYNTHDVRIIGDKTYSVQIQPDGSVGDIIEMR